LLSTEVSAPLKSKMPVKSPFRRKQWLVTRDFY